MPEEQRLRPLLAAGWPCGLSKEARRRPILRRSRQRRAESYSLAASPPLPDHALRSALRSFVQQFQRFLRGGRNQQLPASRRGQETACGCMIHELDKSVPKAADIKQAERLGVIAKYIPAPGFEQFVKRPDTARKCDEG